jgi:hypothetical protein
MHFKSECVTQAKMPAKKRANLDKLRKDRKVAQNRKETASPDPGKRTPPTSKNLVAGIADGSASVIFEREGGPVKWLFPILESAYTVLGERDGTLKKAAGTVKARLSAAQDQVRKTFRSRLQPGQGENVLSTADPNLWLERLKDYKQRKAASFAARVAMPGAVRPGPVIPGAQNWTPLGPSVVLNGQALGAPSVAGRVVGVAVALDGQLVYAASANGGVFRSEDAGQSWRSLMDGFDVDPTNFATTSLACGAIAIDSHDPNRVYVGTGEGDTYALFANRIVNALPAYRGIGPIRSDDGGLNWIVEETVPGSPSLAGQAFFALAVDPGNRENVVAATTSGLYQRIIQADGSPGWIARRPGVHSSVVVASSAGVTKFFAAEWGVGVLQSGDGNQWSALQTPFATATTGRIALGIQSTNPNLLYAFVTNQNGALVGVYRSDSGAVFKSITNPPDVLPLDDYGHSQGDYDLTIAVDPLDANLVYLGGSYFADNQFWPASVWRCQIQIVGSNYKFASTDSIGGRAHADVHVLTHSPSDPNALWVGCDGGVFLNRDPRNSANFGSRNNGLSCLCTTFFAQHPTDPNIIFCGLQDNGTARTMGGAVWKHVNGGDGGYCVINWADPQLVLSFANGSVYRATDGGQDHNSWTRQDFPWAMMTEPIVGTPYNTARPADAKIVALGSAQKVGNTVRPVVYLSQDFGGTWPTIIPIPTATGIYSLAFAGPSRFFAGTASGEVFQVDSGKQAWKVTRLDNVTAGPLGLQGLISDIAIDWTDQSLASVYVTFGGLGDNRRVWHFDGSRWEVRSGPAGAAAGNLLDVEHNVIIVDRVAPNNVYVGADIGVWHSPDQGAMWEPLPNGLPDAAVFDLQIHPTRRLLRASIHGRGLYEFSL